MADRIESTTVLPKGTVSDVSEEPLAKFRLLFIERMILFGFAAFVSVCILLFCGYIMVFNNPAVQNFKDAAWGIIAAFAGGLIGYLTGATQDRRSKNNNT